MNEFRDQLKDQAATLISRKLLDSIVKRQEATDAVIVNWQGRLIVIAGIAALLPTAATLLFHF
jgi:hypothetical protein